MPTFGEILDRNVRTKHLSSVEVQSYVGQVWGSGGIVSASGSLRTFGEVVRGSKPAWDIIFARTEGEISTEHGPNADKIGEIGVGQISRFGQIFGNTYIRIIRGPLVPRVDTPSGPSRAEFQIHYVLLREAQFFFFVSFRDHDEEADNKDDH